MKHYDYLIYWEPNNIEKGQDSFDVFSVPTKEQAFLETARLKKMGTNIQVFKKVELKVELI